MTDRQDPTDLCFEIEPGRFDSISIDVITRQRVGDPALPRCLRVAGPFDGTETAVAMVTDVEHWIETNKGAHAGHRIGSGRITILGYMPAGTPRPNHFFEQWQEVWLDDDATWTSYEEVLGVVNGVLAADFIQLRELEDRGDLGTTPRIVDHDFYLPSESAAQELSTEARRQAMLLCDTTVQDDGWIVSVQRHEALRSSGELGVRFRAELETLAEVHGGTYLGWGCHTSPPPKRGFWATLLDR